MEVTVPSKDIFQTHLEGTLYIIIARATPCDVIECPLVEYALLFTVLYNVLLNFASVLNQIFVSIQIFEFYLMI